MSGVFSKVPKRPVARAAVQDEDPVVRPKRSGFFSPLSTIIVAFVVFMGAQVLAGILIGSYPFLKGYSQQQTQDWLTGTLLAQFFFFLLADGLVVLAIFRLLKRRALTLADIGVDKPNIIDPLYAIGGYVVYFLAYAAVFNFVGKFTSINVDQSQDIGFQSAHGAQLILVFLALVVLAPLAEELLFRGFLFSGLRRKLPFIASALLTSLIFGLGHLQLGGSAPLLWIAAIDTFILSLMLCFLREKTGSIWPGVYVHAIKNFLAFLALFTALFM